MKPEVMELVERIQQTIHGKDLNDLADYFRWPLEKVEQTLNTEGVPAVWFSKLFQKKSDTFKFVLFKELPKSLQPWLADEDKDNDERENSESDDAEKEERQARKAEAFAALAKWTPDDSGVYFLSELLNNQPKLIPGTFFKQDLRRPGMAVFCCDTEDYVPMFFDGFLIGVDTLDKRFGIEEMYALLVPDDEITLIITRKPDEDTPEGMISIRPMGGLDEMFLTPEGFQNAVIGRVAWILDAW